MKVFFENQRGQKICGVLEQPTWSDMVVLFIHGFSSSKNTSSKINAELLNAKGINTLRIDLDNLGESEPAFEESSPRQYAATTIAATKFLETQGYEKIHLVGRSYGAVVVLLAAQEYIYESIVFQSPGAGMYKRLDQYEGLHSWTYTKSNGKSFTMGMQFVEELKEISMTELAKTITCPTLSIHGTADKTCLFGWSEKMVAINDNIKLIPIKGADHDLKINGSCSQSQKAFLDWYDNFL